MKRSRYARILKKTLSLITKQGLKHIKPIHPPVKTGGTE